MDQQTMATAMSIYYFLLKEGELSIKKNKELYFAYSDPEVKAMVEILARESDVSIMKIIDVVYIIPNEENEVFGIKNSDLQKVVGSEARAVNGYLSQYIILLIISMLFSRKGNSPKVDFIVAPQVVEEITKRLSFAASKENIEELEEETEFNIVSVFNHWNALLMDDTNPKVRKTKYGYVRSVCSFLERQGLVLYFPENEQIRSTNKLAHLMSYNFLNKDRIEIIDRLFEAEIKTDITDNDEDEANDKQEEVR